MSITRTWSRVNVVDRIKHVSFSRPGVRIRNITKFAFCRAVLHPVASQGKWLRMRERLILHSPYCYRCCAPVARKRADIAVVPYSQRSGYLQQGKVLYTDIETTAHKQQPQRHESGSEVSEHARLTTHKELLR